ncbi:DegT/DnrJ/EryC1/StrS family aminotransferase [Verrucomicrobiales bacterium]|nr:DegT/DnrJ/EryC1/StrS family aminotransferase [Verrucomicrobiales bacterium]
MRVPFVDLHKQYLGMKSELDNAISEVIKSSDFIRGKHMVPFEEEFAELIDVKHCVSCANGTDALYIALKALGINQGDEVITTAHTWISTSETITQAGANVVFCDTDEKTFNIDPAEIEKKITSKTKGIIVVHLCGQPADIDKIQKLAKDKGLWLIEDCAQSHLAKINGKKVGAFGDVATFSFYPGKNLGAMGDAGAIVTNNDTLAEWMKLFARHGGKGNHVMEGINSRMDGLQAAILRAKLPHLKKWTLKRQKAATLYYQLFSTIPEIITPYLASDREHVYHLYMIKTKNRDALREHLNCKGISTVINYSQALPFYKAYDYLKHKPEDFPRAYQNQNEILSIPIFPEITDEQQRYIVNSISEKLQ